MANNLDAGTTVRALDFQPAANDDEAGSFSFNSPTFGIDVDAGTYNDCGVAFIAPTSGRVLILYKADLRNTTSFSMISPVVRNGSTVGAGTTVAAATDDQSIYAEQGLADCRGSHRLVTGLTSGSTYNVRLEHRCGGGVGTIQRRGVTVISLP